MPARSPAFTGRDEFLLRLQESLHTGNATVVNVLHGIGGVGKTLLAVEYAYRFASDYEMVWWINAERPDLIGEQLAALGVAAGVADVGNPIPLAVTAVRALLRTRDRWLIVFDNASSAAAVAKWIPQGPGHLIITSRSHVWTGVAATLPIDVFTRAESVAFLCKQVPAVSKIDADRLASNLGDLPLALVQAAGAMTETGMPVEEYLRLLISNAAPVLETGAPAGYPASLAATIRIAVVRLGQADLAAATLVQFLALLGPEPVPLWIFATGTNTPDAPLAEVAHDTLALRKCVGRVARFGLVRVGAESIVMHRLTQAVIRDDLGEDRRQSRRVEIEALLLAARPGDAANPRWWPRWAQITPHILAMRPATVTNARFRNLACETVWYQYARGATRAALSLAEELYRVWRQDFGEGDYNVLFAAYTLAVVLQALGNYEYARRLDQDTFARCSERLGADHPNSLAVANSLAVDLRELGNIEEARQLHEETLARRKQVLGADHPDTLVSANSLAIDLHMLGEVQQARQLDEETLARRKQVLGADHPDTLASANSLAIDLRELGQVEEARQLHVETLARRKRVLGADHPDTLASIDNLAIDLRSLGQLDEARQLHEDALSTYKRITNADGSMSGNPTLDLSRIRRYGQVWRCSWVSLD